MNTRSHFALALACAASVATVLLVASTLTAQQVPRAIYTDPPHDSANPARMQVLHVPTGGVKINGVAYVAAGAGRHPTFVFFHGLPGNEKNLDLAQAVRRAGWTAITVNYRGSWGSPGAFRFGNNLEDADAVLAFVRDSANARALGVDTNRIVIAGHSMGGWVAALTAAHDHRVLGAVLISAADMGLAGSQSRADVLKAMEGNLESLAGGTVETFSDDLIAGSPRWRFSVAAPGLRRTPMLVLTSNDGLAPPVDSLVATVRRAGNSRVTTVHEKTDHSWSDRRIVLESAVIRWLDTLSESEKRR
ncbi:MAG TPA: alpha/beta hydrolase [Gemmatimonadaceae bacterium]|jgi:pimeloyl-ACP methyl ester carboxylesterase|nr:alpha/beta hydrolase [Gemmatimonadaceae bacterium]